MSDHPPVAVFWDYENCSPPSNSLGLGYDVVNNIRRIARLFGSVTTFRAYLDISAQSSPKSLVLRSELQSSGVSIIDCPHNGRKDVVDKMILADMLAFAIDHSTPATIFLITGDRDYAYAVSILKLRRYHVILIVPSSPHASTCLESQASLVIDWSLAILRNRTEGLNSTQVIRQPYLDLDPNLVAKVLDELQDVSLDDSDTLLYPTSSTAPRGSSRLGRVSARDLLEPSSIHSANTGSDSAHDPIPASPGKSEAQLPIPKTPSRPRRASVSKGSTRPRSETFATQSPSPLQREVHTKNPSLTDPASPPAQHSLPPLDALDEPFHANGSAGEMPSGTPSSRRLNCLASPFVINKAPPAGLESVPDYPIISLANNDGNSKQPILCPKGNADSAIHTPSRSATPSGKHVPPPAPMFLGVVDDDDDDDDDYDDGDDDDDDGESAQSATSSPPSSAPDHSAPDSLSVLSSAESSTPMSSSDAQEPDQTERRPKWTVFRPLISLLLAAQENGDSRPSRSMIAVSLLQLDKHVYQRAGVLKFRDYTALAEQAGIIELGGGVGGGEAWIALHPNWFEASDVSAIAPQPPSVSSRVSSPRSDPVGVTATNPFLPTLGSRNPLGASLKFMIPSTVTPLPIPTLPTSGRVDGAGSGVSFRLFQPLIDVLVRLRAEGSYQSPRSIVGQLLSQDVYAQAGVMGFKEYVLLASEAQVIQCGGAGVHAWIRLHPGLRT